MCKVIMFLIIFFFYLGIDTKTCKLIKLSIPLPQRDIELKKKLTKIKLPKATYQIIVI